MDFINSLTLNGQSFTMQDPNAVLYTPQTLTGEQKARARANIDACALKEVADKLCLSFAESGTVVTCQPVEGYPLEVTAEGGTTITRCAKNLLNLHGREIYANIGEFSNTNKRPCNGNKLCVGITRNNYLIPGNVTSCEVTETGVTFVAIQSLYGIGFDMAVKPGVKYTISFNSNQPDVVCSLTFYTEDGTWIRDTENKFGQYNFSWTAPSNAKWVIANIGISKDVPDGQEIIITDLMVQAVGDTPDYVPYQSDTYVYEQGMTIHALKGVNTIYADTGVVTVCGRADPTAVIEKLANAVIALGGNV